MIDMANNKTDDGCVWFYHCSALMLFQTLIYWEGNVFFKLGF